VWENGEIHTGYFGKGGRPDGKRPLGRPGNEWEDNIKMNN